MQRKSIFSKKIEECLNCPICLSTIDKDQNRAGPSGWTTYCHKCISFHLSRNKKGPNGRQNISFSKMTNNRNLSNIIDIVSQPTFKEKSLKCADHDENVWLCCTNGVKFICPQGIVEETHKGHKYSSLKDWFKTQKQKMQHHITQTDAIMDKLNSESDKLIEFRTYETNIVEEIKKEITEAVNSEVNKYLAPFSDTCNDIICQYNVKFISHAEQKQKVKQMQDVSKETSSTLNFLLSEGKLLDDKAKENEDLFKFVTEVVDEKLKGDPNKHTKDYKYSIKPGYGMPKGKPLLFDVNGVKFELQYSGMFIKRNENIKSINYDFTLKLTDNVKDFFDFNISFNLEFKNKYNEFLSPISTITSTDYDSDAKINTLKIDTNEMAYTDMQDVSFYVTITPNKMIFVSKDEIKSKLLKSVGDQLLK